MPPFRRFAFSLLLIPVLLTLMLRESHVTAQPGTGIVLIPEEPATPPPSSGQESGDETTRPGPTSELPEPFLTPRSWLTPGERRQYQREMEERKRQDDLQRAFQAEETRRRMQAERETAERVRRFWDELKKQQKTEEGDSTAPAPGKTETKSVPQGEPPKREYRGSLRGTVGEEAQRIAKELARKNTQETNRTGERTIFNPLPLEEHLLREGWCQLFDGRSFLGWRIQDSPSSPYRGGRFYMTKSEPGVIQCDPAHPGLLFTTSQFANASVTFEFQCPDDAEVLLLLRSPPSPRDLHTSCYAVVLNSPTRRAGTILGRRGAEPADDSFEQTAITGETDGENWRTCNAFFDRGTIKVTVGQGEPVAFYDSMPLGYGHLGLLVAKGPAKFRNLLWLPGASSSLFNGLDFASWRYDKAHPPAIARGDNVAIQMTGPAILEYKQEFKNFSLQLEFSYPYSQGPAGVYFRSTPRHARTGYDCSIDLLPSPEDLRTIPGCDAGGLRGLADARFLNISYRPWSRLTLNVIDRHIQTWVDGIPVCDWGDLRPPDPARPTGPFLEKGTLQLNARQGTRILFRNIQISTALPRHFDPQSQFVPTSWEDQNRRRQERERRATEDDGLLNLDAP